MRHGRWLPKSDYLPFAPEHVGINRVNHNSDYCHGDSPSMIVERKEDGSVAAHCFRCGGGGFSTPRLHHLASASIREASAKRNEDRQVVVGGIELPNDTTGIEDDFPQTARAWLKKAGLTRQQVEAEGFLWSDERNCLYIPVRQSGDLKGFVQRYFDTDEKVYRTLKLDSRQFFGYYRQGVDKPTRSVVIVEDTLSALRVSEICDTLSVLGTNILPSAVSLILKEGYEEAIIFLDADNPTVRMQARRIASKLPFVKTRFVETGADPKHYSKEQLTKLIFVVE